MAAGYANAVTGRGTYYGGNVQGGMCSFTSYTLPTGIDGTAISKLDWAGSGVCGACIKVTGPRGSTTAMIVDQCPECPEHALDLFQNAFGKIDDPQKGIIQLSWEFVPCPLNGLIYFRMKEGVSAYWFSVQAVNAGKRVKDIQVSTNGGATWQGGLTRMEYNFFQKSAGFGVTKVDLKVISIDGEETIARNCEVVGGNTCTAAGNF
ncbi:putative extracellular cellulase CelA/allergen Asp F7-like protein [Zymoseptoria brevis]|uniref:Putative extracellular cellulase CelA/allergen Asp F7-like protein n=1 Tax=Zymoseptoria brevis TaxID=1047168 RepID=A0A0F4GN70_9PEZI|nr:putative extracellular cellulase CelA/allergen Asp F7-like protein [Zymoseptoria brevis]